MNFCVLLFISSYSVILQVGKAHNAEFIIHQCASDVDPYYRGWISSILINHFNNSFSPFTFRSTGYFSVFSYDRKNNQTGCFDLIENGTKLETDQQLLPLEYFDYTPMNRTDPSLSVVIKTIEEYDKILLERNFKIEPAYIFNGALGYGSIEKAEFLKNSNVKDFRMTYNLEKRTVLKIELKNVSIPFSQALREFIQCFKQHLVEADEHRDPLNKDAADGLRSYVKNMAELFIYNFGSHYISTAYFAYYNKFKKVYQPAYDDDKESYLSTGEGSSPNMIRLSEAEFKPVYGIFTPENLSFNNITLAENHRLLLIHLIKRFTYLYVEEYKAYVSVNCHPYNENKCDSPIFNASANKDYRQILKSCGY